MTTGRAQMAQYVYLAQLQAAKGSCKCKVCELMRKTIDGMTEEVLEGNPGALASPLSMIPELEALGYKVSPPGQQEEEQH